MRATRGARGFTLIELLAVLAILGVILFMMVPALDGLTPRKRLETSARKLASTMDLAQGRAIGEGKDMVLSYDLDKNSYDVLLPPPPAPETPPDPAAKPPPWNDIEHGLPPVLPATDANGTPAPAPDPGAITTDGRESLGVEFIPEDVEFASVAIRDKSESTSGNVLVKFSRLGDEGSHIVALRLKGPDGQKDTGQIWVKYNALTRTFEISDKRLSWEKVAD